MRMAPLTTTRFRRVVTLEFYYVVVYRTYMCQTCTKTWRGIDEHVIAKMSRVIRRLATFCFTARTGLDMAVISFVHECSVTGVSAERARGLLDSMHARRWLDVVVRGVACQCLTEPQDHHVSLAALRRSSPFTHGEVPPQPPRRFDPQGYNDYIPGAGLLRQCFLRDHRRRKDFLHW